MDGQQKQSCLGYKWVCPFTEDLISKDEGVKSVNEREYFEECKARQTIEFKKEPPRALTQAFDVSIATFSNLVQNSGFAMFKGKNWRYFMQKLYCVIGRSPINYKKKNLDLKVVWHVDVDLGHLRKVSR